MSGGTKHPADKTSVGTKLPETKHPFGLYSILNLKKNNTGTGTLLNNLTITQKAETCMHLNNIIERM
jgi:hypothetical protein